MLCFLEQLCTHIFLSYLIGLVFAGWDLMLAEPSWVSVVPIECLWNDKKPSFGLISGQSLSLHLFIFIVLLHWAGCCFA
jgi:hypothetical protein